ncbi:protein of unknown function [Candidatus Nitrosotalea okcheonensis]|uniref:Uncharacterized protein n=2 Tax=Candidatus Nitrosotalea okcheonensis TaxID=1903276 RepID=A0A2H1FC67_9ARCH|nr:protein of unknown function [Candidatus Nitrosotalea okcheonensis]
MASDMRGICIVCEFQVRGNTLEELDESFRLHFENNGHDSYFFIDKEGKKIERDISKL